MNIVPFTRKPKTPDRDLENKLRGEWPGILRWMIEGCLEWQSNGLSRPDSVAEATDAYFEENDLLGSFLDEWCEADPYNDRWYSAAPEVFKRWKDYAISAGEEPGSAQWLGENMAKRGFQKVKKTLNGTRGMAFVGVHLKQFNGLDD